MAEETDLEKLKRDYPEFFERVLPELIEFVLSEETSSKIAEICLKNGVKDEEKIEKIAYRITLVLLERFPGEKLVETIEKEGGLAPEAAQKISAEVNRLIFSQIPAPASPPPPKEEATEEPPKPPGKDVYREPVE